MAPCSVIGACVELFGATDGRRQQCGHPVRGGHGGARTRRCVERWRSTSSALCSAASAPSREDPRGRGTIVNVVVGALIDLPELTSYGATRSPRWPLAYPALRRERSRAAVAPRVTRCLWRARGAGPSLPSLQLSTPTFPAEASVLPRFFARASAGPHGVASCRYCHRLLIDDTLFLFSVIVVNGGLGAILSAVGHLRAQACNTMACGDQRSSTADCSCTREDGGNVTYG